MYGEDGACEIGAVEPADGPPRGQGVGVERERSARTDRGILIVPPAVGVRCRHLDGWNRNEGWKGRRRRETELALSAAPRNRERGTSRKERHVGAQAGSEMQELVPRNRVAREDIHGVQRRGAVAPAATESGPNGDTLGQRDRYAESVARRAEQGSRRTHGKLVIGGPKHTSRQ